jgi:hypothetical protein
MDFAWSYPIFEEMLQSKDDQERLRALAEKQKPEFTGAIKKGENEVGCQKIDAGLHERSLFRSLTTS